MEGEEIFDPAHLGSTDEVVKERTVDDDVILIKTKTSGPVCGLLICIRTCLIVDTT